MSDQELLNLKKEVRSLLIPAKNGLTPQQLEKDYLEIVGSRLPLRGLGYRSTMDMVRDMPDVVDVYSTADGNVLLKGIPDETTKGIAHLVAKQKPSKPTKSSRLRYSHHKTRVSSFNSYSKLPRRSRVAPMLPAVVKSELKDLLSFSPVLLSNFDQAYRQRFGRDFQYIRYGFYSMFEVLHAASDILTVQQTRAGSLLVLNSSHLVNPGRMYAIVEQRYASSLLGKPPVVHQLPLNREVATSLSTVTLQFGALKRCETPYRQEKNAAFGMWKNEGMQYMQVQNSPSFTKKPLVTHNLQRTSSTTDFQKREVTLFSPGQGSSLGTQKEFEPSYIQKSAMTFEDQRSIVVPSLQRQTFTSVTQENEVVHCVKEQQSLEIHQKMFGKPPFVMGKLELTLGKPTIETAGKSYQTFSSLQRLQASHPSTTNSGTHCAKDRAPPAKNEKSDDSCPMIHEVTPNPQGLMTHLKTQNMETVSLVNYNVNPCNQGPVTPSEAKQRETLPQVNPLMAHCYPKTGISSETQKGETIPPVNTKVILHTSRSVTLTGSPKNEALPLVNPVVTPCHPETLPLENPMVTPCHPEPVISSKAHQRETFARVNTEPYTRGPMTPPETKNGGNLPPVNDEMTPYSQGSKFPAETQKIEFLSQMISKVEATQNLQECASPPSIKKSDLLPTLELPKLPTVAHTDTPDLPAVGTTEYFVWKLQQLEEEMKISLAKKGPGGTVEAELKEKIRFLAAQHDEGLLVNKLPVEFKDVFEEEIDLKKLGFVNLLELVVSLGDILHLECKDGDQELRIFDAKKWKRSDEQKLTLISMQSNNPQIDGILPAIQYSSWDSPHENHTELNPKSLGIITHDSQVWKLKEPLFIPDSTKAEVPPDAVRDQSLHCLPRLEFGTMLGVYVESITSPSKFYIRSYTKDTSEVLENMMIEMRRCYSSENVRERYAIPPDWIRPGFVCCVRIKDDAWWYRVIVHCVSNEQEVEVFYPDFGNLATVKRTWLRLLKSCYLKVAAQAVPSALAWVRPVEGRWTTAAIMRLKNLCDLRPLVALVDEYIDGILYLFLCDTTTDEDLYLHNVLREEGHAILSKENLSCKNFGEESPAKLYLKTATKESTSEPFISKDFPSPLSSASQNSFPVGSCKESNFTDRPSLKLVQGGHGDVYVNRSQSDHSINSPLLNLSHYNVSLANQPSGQCPKHLQGGHGDTPVSEHETHQQNRSVKNQPLNLPHYNVSPASQPPGAAQLHCSISRHPRDMQKNSAPETHQPDSHHQVGSAFMHACGSDHPADFSTKHSQGLHEESDLPRKNLMGPLRVTDSPAEHQQKQFVSSIKHLQASPGQCTSPTNRPNSQQQDGHSNKQKIRLDATGLQSNVESNDRNHEMNLPYLEPAPANSDVWDENWPLSTYTMATSPDSSLRSKTEIPSHLSNTNAREGWHQSSGHPVKAEPVPLQQKDSCNAPWSTSHHPITPGLREQKSLSNFEEYDPSEESNFFGEPLETVTLPKDLEEFYISLIKSKQSTEHTSQEPSLPASPIERPQTKERTASLAKEDLPASRTVSPAPRSPPSARRTVSPEPNKVISASKASPLTPRVEALKHKAGFHATKSSPLAPSAETFAAKTVSPALMSSPLAQDRTEVFRSKVEYPAPRSSSLPPRAETLLPKTVSSAPSSSPLGPRAEALTPKAGSPAPNYSTLEPRAEALAPKIVFSTPGSSPPPPKTKTVTPWTASTAPRSSPLATRAEALAPKAETLAARPSPLFFRVESLVPRAEESVPKADVSESSAEGHHPLIFFSSHEFGPLNQDTDANHLSPMQVASAPVSRKIHIPRISTTAVLGAAARMATAGGLLRWFPGAENLE